MTEEKIDRRTRCRACGQYKWLAASACPNGDIPGKLHDWHTSTKQEAGEVSCSQTAHLEEALAMPSKDKDDLIAERLADSLIDYIRAPYSRSWLVERINAAIKRDTGEALRPLGASGSEVPWSLTSAPPPPAALSTKQEAGEVSRSQTAQALEKAAQVADEQATQSAESYKEALKANDPIGMTCSGARERMALRIAKRIRALQQDSGEVSRSQTAAQALEEAAAKIKALGDHIDPTTNDKWDHGYLTAITGALDVIRALSLPAPDAGWRNAQVLERLQIARLNGLFDASTELTMPGDSDNVPAILDAVEAALSLPAPDGSSAAGAGSFDALEAAAKVADTHADGMRALRDAAQKSGDGLQAEEHHNAMRISEFIAKDIRALRPLPAPPVGDQK